MGLIFLFLASRPESEKFRVWPPGQVARDKVLGSRPQIYELERREGRHCSAITQLTKLEFAGDPSLLYLSGHCVHQNTLSFRANCSRGCRPSPPSSLVFVGEPDTNSSRSNIASSWKRSHPRHQALVLQLTNLKLRQTEMLCSPVTFLALFIFSIFAS